MVSVPSGPIGGTSEDRLAVILSRIEKDRDRKQAEQAQAPGGKNGPNGPNGPNSPNGPGEPGAGQQTGSTPGSSDVNARTNAPAPKPSTETSLQDSYSAPQEGQPSTDRGLERVSNGAPAEKPSEFRLQEHISGLDRRRALQPGDPNRTPSLRPTSSPKAAGSPASINELAAPDLQTRISDLQNRASQLEQRVDAYGQVQDWVAGHNLGQVSAMADQETKSATRSPFPSFGAGWDKIGPIKQDNLRQINQETVRQMREDLKAGRTSAMIDPAELQNAKSGTEARAQMRFNQLLQDNDIPKDFSGHSPASMKDLESLQELGDGRLPELQDRQGTLDSIGQYLDRFPENKRNGVFDKMLKSGRVPPGLGMDRAIPNAKDIPQTMQELEQQRDALNQELKELGRDPLELPSLEKSKEKLEQLDRAITDYGRQLDARLEGNAERYDRMVRPGEGPKTISEAQKEELVRANDSLNLLRNNRSGLSLKDVPLSPQTKDAIGLPDWIQGDKRMQQPAFPEIFKMPKDRLSTMEKIDHAALLPREQREQHLRSLNSNLYGDSYGEKLRTEGIAEMDNTTLNRVSEAIDPTAYLFNRNRTDWIGPRAQLRTEQAKNIHKKVSKATDEASTALINGQHSAAMEKMRETVSPMDFHKGINAQYERQNDESNMRSAMTLATLPLSALPMARAGLSGAKTLGRGSARLLGGSGRRLATSMAKSAPVGSTRRQLARSLSKQLRRVTPGNVMDDLARSGRHLGSLNGPRMTAADRLKGGPRAGTGGRFGVDEIGFHNAGHDLEKVEGMRRQLMRRSDLGAVQKDLQRMGVKADREMLDAVKKYNFDSPGLGFYQDNYAAWNRLASGKGTVADAQYLAHEMAEVKALRRIQQKTGFDFMGKNYAKMTERQARTWQKQFRENYLTAHREALQAEYDFLSKQISSATQGRVNVGRNIAAANDPTRAEALDWMMQDGVPLRQHRQFGQWAARGDELVDISNGVRQNLGIPRGSRVTLSELIRRIKHAPAGGF